MSYNDIYYGIPSILTCGKMVLFALFHCYAYSAKPYFFTSSMPSNESQIKPGNLYYHGGFLGIMAFAAALNPREILSGLIMMLRYIMSNPPVQQNYGAGTIMEPIHPGQAGRHQPPAYMPAGGAYHEFAAPQRAHSPNAVEYGTVKQYTPLSRPQY